MTMSISVGQVIVYPIVCLLLRRVLPSRMDLGLALMQYVVSFLFNHEFGCMAHRGNHFPPVCVKLLGELLYPQKAGNPVML